MPSRVRTLDLTPAVEYAPELTNKRDTLHNGTDEQREALFGSGYVPPKSWGSLGRLRPFVGWDGEGCTHPGRQEQSYVLFGASTGEYITSEDLGTAECFDLLLQVERNNPHSIHVGFGLRYDVNMILRDLSESHLRRIYDTNKVRWRGYHVEYRPGKWLSIRKGEDRVRLFDVFGFFQSSFVTACEKFLGRDDPELIRIREGKASRSVFQFDELESIIDYWKAELRMTVRLMNALRDDLDSAELKINSWHGPGAIASTVFRKHSVQDSKNDSPKEVLNASQYAYAGGRFELFQCGHYPHTVYEYDINSAYPYVISQLPDLRSGYWESVSTFEPDSFGVWRVDYVGRGYPPSIFYRPQPLFVRDRNACVTFPSVASGWYWTPEAAFVSESSIREGWVFRERGGRPFNFVREMYLTRQQWKREGNSAERALKLALNSLYGKMAQRSGWQEGEPIPKWHQLEWAGYVTSKVRSMLWEAIQQNPGKIIAVETDAVFSKVPLDLPVSDQLGEWSLDTFDWITYLQSGLYYAGQGDELIERYRGFDRGSLPYDRVMEYLSAPRRNERLFGKTTRFVGLGIALQTNAVWRSWSTDLRAVDIGGGGKRTHSSRFCPACKRGATFAQAMHPLVITTEGGESHPHCLPWIQKEVPDIRDLEWVLEW